MIKHGPVYRSRRRRSSFALFGRHVQRASVQPFPDRVWPAEDRMREMVSEPAPRAARPHQNELDDMAKAIQRVQQDARADRALAGRLPEPELDRLVAEIVHNLWQTSKVKTFVPVIALRHARETLGLPERDTEALTGPGGVEV